MYSAIQKTIVLLFFFFLGTTIVTGQDYITYHRIINRVTDDLIAEKYNDASARFDSLYSAYSFIYASHCFAALQTECTRNDSIKALRWLEKCFIHGVPLGMVKENGITKNVSNFSSARHIMEKYDSLHGIYLSRINLSVRHTIDSIFVIDQLYTEKYNSSKLFPQKRISLLYKRHFDIIRDITLRYGYPSEKLIGIYVSDNDSSMISEMQRYGPILSEFKTFTLMIHYYSDPNSIEDSLFYTNLQSGFMKPYHFGCIYDFYNHWSVRGYKNRKYYKAWYPFPKTAETPEQINARRLSIGLDTFEKQRQIYEIQRLQRQNRRCNEVILLH